MLSLGSNICIGFLQIKYIQFHYVSLHVFLDPQLRHKTCLSNIEKLEERVLVNESLNFSENFLEF